ncbi:NAD(P)/FAD-dependent oxidoreductase [Mycobacteroides chelonae]|uniref:flavin-containing monooxygenase n=1 Tax=Mycobacteroides chelonae TaxID=1774 RepID=UPI000A73B78D
MALAAAIMSERDLFVRNKHTKHDPRIAIIGAGVSGITMAVRLKKAGFENFVILEKGSAVGGVWHWNRYPGLTCDVPSHVYQFGFAPKGDWSRLFSGRDEIQRYMSDVTTRFGLDAHLHLGTEIVSAEFTGASWQIGAADGREFMADFLIAATGILHHPFTPDIDGLDEFAGELVHTARWRDGIRTAGKRVAVVGTGSTGVQVVSALQPIAAYVRHFTRTPQWVMWAPMGLKQPRIISALLSRMPAIGSAIHHGGMLGNIAYTDIMIRPSWRRRLAQSVARASLRIQVRDPELRARLTPDDEPFCKRQVVSGSYYRAIAAPNADLITSPIERVVPTGIRTADGKQHAVDLLILATGFQAHNYMRPMHIRGRDGFTLNDAWDKGPRGYAMTAIPGFPNLFTIGGPTSPLPTHSLHYVSELTATYVIKWLQRFRDGEFSTVEVTEEATTRFNDQVAQALPDTVFATGCNSYYLSENNQIDAFPFNRRTLKRMLVAPNDNDFIMTR